MCEMTEDLKGTPETQDDILSNRPKGNERILLPFDC